MHPQKHASTTLLRYLVSDTVDGIPLEMHVWALGSKRVSMTAHAIVSEMGHSHCFALIGNGPTSWDQEPLVRLALRQQERLRRGLPLLSKEAEDSFLESCPAPIGRPESRIIVARRERAKREKAGIMPRRDAA
jgi:hypothetical protein